MLDFKEKTYQKLLDLAVKKNIINNCREYPSLTYGGQLTSMQKISRFLKNKFNEPDFKCGLYVHFPFCSSRCSFCKYYSEVENNQQHFAGFLKILNKELEQYKVNFKDCKLENLFLGGGTPTLLNQDNTEKLMGIINRYFDFKIQAQKTIEGTPESITLDKVKQYKNLGINRVSLGLQSSNDDVLKAVNRKHNSKDVFKAFDLIRKAGIDCIGTELIWGLPQETIKSYLKTFDDLIKLSPDFIEGYLLTQGARAKLKPYCPQGTTLTQLIELGKEKLLSGGYRLVFEGNFLGFVKKGVLNETAVNNNTDSLYRHKASVLGIGPGASSHFRDIKYIIKSDYQDYKHRISQGRSPEIYSLFLTEQEYRRHYIISQIGFFRVIYKNEYKHIFQNDLTADFPKEIKMLKEQNVINESEDAYFWHLGSLTLDPEIFYLHILKYWYSRKYINWIIDILLKW